MKSTGTHSQNFSRGLRRRPFLHAAIGVTMLELMIVVTIILIVAAIAIPNLMQTIRSYRLSGDARSVAAELRLAQLRAGAGFTQARVYFDTTSTSATYNDYWLDVWDKSSSAWVSQGCVPGAALHDPGCAQHLSAADIFDYGTIATGAGGSSSGSGTCQSGGGPAWPATGGIVFDSRGFPVNPANNTFESDYAVYIGGPAGSYYAVCADLSGKITIWTYQSQNSAWIKTR